MDLAITILCILLFICFVIMFIQARERNKRIKTLLDNTLMVWADCSKNILDSSAASDDLSKYYLDVLYGRIPESSILNGKIKGFHNVGGTFDLVVSNFAIHYFFENETTLRNVIGNISGSLRPGGKFVCTTLNGQSVFDNLRYSNIFNSHTMSWKITKKYTEDTFPSSSKSLGYKIEVFVESIGQSMDEYLVNPDYFEEILNDYADPKKNPEIAKSIAEMNADRAKGKDHIDPMTYKHNQLIASVFETAKKKAWSQIQDHPEIQRLIQKGATQLEDNKDATERSSEAFRNNEVEILNWKNK